MRATGGATSRDGLSIALDKYLRRADPVAHRIIEAIETVSEDVIDTAGEWADSDQPLYGYVAIQDGGARIEGSQTSLALGGTTNADEVVTDLDRVSPLRVVEIEWSQQLAGVEDRELDAVTVRLDPDVDGSGREVSEWRCRLYRLHQITDGEEFDLQPITEVVSVEAAGTAIADVTFDFRGRSLGAPARVGPAPFLAPAAIEAGFSEAPRTYIQVWAVTAEGEAATNVAWMGAAGETQRAVAGEYTSRLRRLDEATNADVVQQGTLYLLSAAGGDGLPEFELFDISFTTTTIEFTGANQLDLGNTPTLPVEVIAVGQTPGGSSILFELSDPSSSGVWVEVADGDVIGEDNTPLGGNDLSGLAVLSAYDARVTLTVPPAGDFSSPTVRRFGIREIRSIDLEGEADLISYERAIDPTDLHSEIGRGEIRMLKTGVVDYRDYFTELFSENWINEIELRVWIGASVMDRKDWLLLETFRVEDPKSSPAHGTLTVVDALVYLKGPVPPAASGNREAVVYENQLLSDVRDDLITGQLGVPGRFVGPNLVDLPIDTDADGETDYDAVVTRTLRDEEAKKMVNAIDFLAGGSSIASQGRIKWVGVHKSETDPTPHPVVAFPLSTIAVGDVSPGYQYRQPEIFVPFGWDEASNNGSGAYEGEESAVHADSLSKLGATQVRRGRIPLLDDSIARWIPADTSSHSGLAELVAERQVEALGLGMIVITFTSIYAYPELEIGDIVAVQTDRFVGRHPSDDRPLRGLLWLTGPIVRVADPMGRTFQVWVRSYEDILPGVTAIARVKYGDPRLISATGTVDSDGVVDLDIAANGDANSIRYAVSTSAFPSRATTEAGTLEALDDDHLAHIDAVSTLDIGETLFVSVLAYEAADGSGNESIELREFRVHREPEQVAPTFEMTKSQSGSVGTLDIVLNDPAGRVTATAFEVSTDPDYDPGDPSTWDIFDTTAPFTLTETVTLEEKQTTTIHVAVRYDDQDGNSVYDIKSAEFDPDEVARLTAFAGSTNLNNKVTASYTGDEDTAEIYFTVGVNSTPSDPTSSVNDGSTTTVPSGTVVFNGSGGFATKNAVAGDIVIIKAAVENPNGEVASQIFQTQFKVPGTPVEAGALLTNVTFEMGNEGVGNDLIASFSWDPDPSLVTDGDHDVVVRAKLTGAGSWDPDFDSTEVSPQTNQTENVTKTGAGTASEQDYDAELDLIDDATLEVLERYTFSAVESGPA